MSKNTPPHHRKHYSAEQERYESFDGLRAYSAIGIALMHYWANMEDGPEGFLYHNIIAWFTHFVYLFFILSAFSMCCGYFHKFDIVDGRSGFDTERFYSKRYSRIWPFFAVLVLMDFCMKPSMEELYQCFADLTLAFNLLPNPQIDAIGVGWFLGVIFLFYMIFPWFAYLLQNKKRAWFAMTVALVFHIIVVHYFLTGLFCTQSQIDAPRHNIVYSFPFLMSGGLLYLYKDRLHFKRPVIIYGLLALAVLMTISQWIYHPRILGENILYQLLLFIVWMVYAMNSRDKVLNNRFTSFIGRISMEIYLCHMVMYRIVEKIHLEKIFSNDVVRYWIICLIGLSLAVTFSWLIKEWGLNKRFIDKLRIAFN